MCKRTRRFPVTPSEAAQICRFIDDGSISHASGRKVYRYIATEIHKLMDIEDAVHVQKLIEEI